MFGLQLQQNSSASVDSSTISKVLHASEEGLRAKQGEEVVWDIGTDDQGKPSLFMLLAVRLAVPRRMGEQLTTILSFTFEPERVLGPSVFRLG